MPEAHDTIRAVQWHEGRLWLLDQRRLPERETYLAIDTAPGAAEAIREMAVRGAPAIGVATAYAVVLAARDAYARDPEQWRHRMEPDLERLLAARPTAVNLAWAVRAMRRSMAQASGDPVPALLEAARRIQAEDLEANHRMGECGADLIQGPAVLTHCNTGSLATAGYGTALGVIRSAYRRGSLERVYVDETRPWLQGSRLTAWELGRDSVPASLICDGAAAALMRGGRIDWVVVGADRVAANGDAANKIGTYGLAVLARHHGVGFMVVAPASTIDAATPDGDAIPIEARDPSEVLTLAGQRVAPVGAEAWNPAFDVTPAGLVDALVTDRGVVRAPDRAKLADLLA